MSVRQEILWGTRIYDTVLDYILGDSDFKKLADENNLSKEEFKKIAEQTARDIRADWDDEEYSYHLDKKYLDIAWLEISLTKRKKYLVNMDDVWILFKVYLKYRY